jgi:acyl dehydratase
MERFYEDFAVGQVFRSGRIKVDADQIKAFAATYDPQPFHLDEGAAHGTFFEGLAASGWHTAALTMRLLVTSDIQPAGGFIGAGFTELRWPRPVRPGDELSVESEVLDLQPWSRASHGLMTVCTTTLNQRGKAVQVQVGTLVVMRRPH